MRHTLKHENLGAVHTHTHTHTHNFKDRAVGTTAFVLMPKKSKFIMKGYSFKSDAKNVSERNGTQIVLGEKGYQTKKNKGRKVVKDTTLKIMEKRRTERRKRNILYICLSFLRALYQKTNKTKTI